MVLQEIGDMAVFMTLILPTGITISTILTDGIVLPGEALIVLSSMLTILITVMAFIITLISMAVGFGMDMAMRITILTTEPITA